MKLFWPLGVLRSVVPGERLSFGRELLASVVVFLVALPLCMGIAIACGVPPALGLVTGIVAGLVVGTLSGAPLQVSGPAAGLVVLVWEFINQWGLQALGVVVLLAGAMQFLGGMLRMGRFLRAVSPAVIQGMLAGIGVLIFASQFHVMVDDKPRGSGLSNLAAIPEAIVKAFSDAAADGGPNHRAAAMVGITTIAVLVGWTLWKRRPKALRTVPGPLLGVVVGTALASALSLTVQRVQPPADLLAAVQPPSLETFKVLANPAFWLSGLAIAVIASAETLLSAAAVDKMHRGERANFDRELAAQGVGNLICGALGALPMTGVIVRSSANVEAGAQSRLSAILHGAWLLIAVAVLPSMLALIPVAALAAILVFTGYKLVNVGAIKQLSQSGRGEVAVYAITLIGVVATDLLTGVALGVAASVVRLAWQTAHLEVSERQTEARHELHLAGAATFLQLPKLSESLQRIPVGKEAHVFLEELIFVDHASLELLETWQETYKARGGQAVVYWSKLKARGYSRTQVPAAEATAAPGPLHSYYEPEAKGGRQAEARP